MTRRSTCPLSAPITTVCPRAVTTTSASTSSAGSLRTLNDRTSMLAGSAISSSLRYEPEIVRRFVPITQP